MLALCAKSEGYQRIGNLVSGVLIIQRNGKISSIRLPIVHRNAFPRKVWLTLLIGLPILQRIKKASICVSSHTLMPPSLCDKNHMTAEVTESRDWQRLQMGDPECGIAFCHHCVFRFWWCLSSWTSLISYLLALWGCCVKYSSAQHTYPSLLCLEAKAKQNNNKTPEKTQCFLLNRQVTLLWFCIGN